MLSQVLMVKMYNGYIMSNRVTRDHHNLRRNLKLNGKYISNDGGDEGITVDDAGVVQATALDVVDDFKVLYNSTNYFKIDALASGATNITTVDATGSNDAKITFQPQGDLIFIPGASDYFSIQPVTKTSSTAFNSSVDIQETLDSDTGGAGEFTAGGSDVHYGIRYRQTQTDLAGWDSVYLMFLDAVGSGNEFSVDDKAQTYIDINNTSTVASTAKGLHIDIDKTALIGAGGLNTVLTGIDVDINTDSGAGHATSTNSNIGLDIDLVGTTYGTSHVNTGVDINVSGATTNYALITSGGNVGIGEAAPQDTLEVNGTVLVKDALKFTQDDGNEFIDSQNDGYLDIGATTAIRLEQDTLVESTKKLYFNDAGGEHISGDGDDLTIVAGTNLNLDGGSIVRLYDDTVLYCSFTKGAGSALNVSSIGNLILNPGTDEYIKLGGGTGFVQVTATFDATDTDIDFRDGNKQILTLTADITDVHFQFPAVSGNFLCIFLQDGTGGWDVTNWKTKDEAGNAGAGGVVRWAGGSATTLTETADKADIVSIYWDATNEVAYAVASENF